MTIMEYRQIFADNLKRLLKAKNMTQKELSEHIHVSTGNVSNWMALKSAPRINKVDEIANVLGVRRSDLLEPPPKQETDPRLTRLSLLWKEVPENKRDELLALIESVLKMQGLL